MTPSDDTYETIEKPLWFGPDDRPLFGWLTAPVGGLARGGVLCAPPIGREVRAGRRAIRSLAIALATKGFVTLRFDYDGTGDSSGSFNDVGRDQHWIQSVVEATKYLRSLGLDSVSAVGMRLGATLIGVADDRHQLGFSSVVLWDLCESGKSFLRENHALEALRRDDFRIVTGAPVETSEYVFSTRAAEEVRGIDISKTTAPSFGERTLVVSRSDRNISKGIKARLPGDNVEWRLTNEQASLLDVDTTLAVLPNQTIDEIVTWLCAPSPTLTPFGVAHLRMSGVVANVPGRLAVNERIVECGPEKLFGIVSEPVENIQGPLIVMLNVANAEHTGPSRLWVDLSRRWAGFGMRSVRFDFRGLADSPWPPIQSDSEFFFEHWLEDILVVAQELNPEDPSNTVFIGLCSGAFWAVEAALVLRVRGICIINPPRYIDVLHSVRKLETSHQPRIRQIGERLKHFTERRFAFAKHQWLAAASWHLIRVFLPSALSADILKNLGDDDIDLLLIYGPEEIWPYPRIPYFRSLDVRRLSPTKERRMEFVPELDHGMHSAEGRTRTVNILDRYILEHFGEVTSGIDTSFTYTDES